MRRLPRLQYLVWKIDKTRGQFPTDQALSFSSPAPSNACEQPPRVCTVPTYSSVWSRSQTPSVGCAGHSASEEELMHHGRRSRARGLVSSVPLGAAGGPLVLAGTAGLDPCPTDVDPDTAGGAPRPGRGRAAGVNGEKTPT